MSAIYLDGKTEAEKIRAEIKKEIAETGITPVLAVLLIGNDPASQLYVSIKEKIAAEVGIKVLRFNFPEDIRETDIVKKIKELNNDDAVNGILVQLPLPAALNPNAVINAINPEKDVDGFHPNNATGIISPGISGPIALIGLTGEALKGKHAVVVGNSAVYTQSFCDVLRQMEMRAEPTYPENKELIKQADILVTAIGRPHFIGRGDIKTGAIIIDIGTTRVDGKTIGDVAPAAAETAAFITPVPGGVGPMTVAMLLKNIVALYKRQHPENSSEQ
jgi:methylenetetrahydrofolate dehydrogenase (NADP+)/methenyltetrahydrofolate cyclohydrolase